MPTWNYLICINWEINSNIYATYEVTGINHVTKRTIHRRRWPTTPTTTKTTQPDRISWVCNWAKSAKTCTKKYSHPLFVSHQVYCIVKYNVHVVFKILQWMLGLPFRLVYLIHSGQYSHYVSRSCAYYNITTNSIHHVYTFCTPVWTKDGITHYCQLMSVISKWH